MTEVLVVARTKMGRNVCIGGLRLDMNANVRLMTSEGGYQPSTSAFEVGGVYEITLGPITGFEPPHVENVGVVSAAFLRKEHAVGRLLGARVGIARGDPEALFEGKLAYTSTGRPYIGRGDLPKGSVAFWRPSRALTLEGKRYVYARGRGDRVEFTYAGVAAPTEEIPLKSIVRVSLATWWPLEDPYELQRCYTQISGWFEG